MHVALFTPAWPIDRFQNGIITFVHWMRRELESLGHRVSIFTSQLDASFLPDPQVHLVVDRSPVWLQRVRDRLYRPGGKAWAYGGVLADAIRAVNERDPIDLVEMEESFGWAEQVRRRTGLPVLVKLHGPAFQSLIESELTTPFARERIMREGYALQRADAIAAPSSDTLVQTLSHYGLAPAICEHITNPLDTYSDVPLWSLDASAPGSLLFVGRFDRRKGGDVMLDAFARVHQKRPEARLTFVGPDSGVVHADGSCEHFNNYALRALSPETRQCVDYRGRLENTAIPPLRQCARVVIVPSRWESQGYTAVEALLQGCPVVASDTGGLPESVRDGHTGRLARPGDPDDLARQILEMLENPQASAALGKAGREHVLDHHASRDIALQSLDLYERVIAHARRR